MPEIMLSRGHTIIHYKDTLLLTDLHGWIGGSRTGLFSQDTRYLSSYRLTLNGFDPRFLGASRPHYFATTFYYTNPSIGTPPNLIPENSLLLKVSRYVLEGMHEDVILTNYAGKPIQLTLMLVFETDFADIFQVRGLERLIPRIAEERWNAESKTLFVQYRKGDFARKLAYRFTGYGSPPVHALGTFTFRISLKRGETWHCCNEVHLEDRPTPGHPTPHTFLAMREALDRWQSQTAHIDTPVLELQRTYDQAIVDLASLRLDEANDRWFTAAGVPWYAALFGRDSLITALQTLTAYCPFGLGALERLSQLQGTKVDNWTEEEPGKIPHELRHGELASTGKIPHTPYYGTVDASLLYVILVHELYRFHADVPLLRRYYDSAAACLEWAARYGDIDDDGFVEYHRRSPKGYRNQGWKDAFDAIVYPDGSLVDPPIAICEVQGYYYDALTRMSDIARLCDHEEEAATYAHRAEELFERFNKVFWLADEGYYALGLDPRKQPIAAIGSNPGHLLWSGIVPEDRAQRLVDHLMSEDMFSGWGVRTLSAANPAFDPLSYQRGSVWPHDNAIIALGLKRYGFWQETNRIAEGIFNVAACYEQHSLPELFAGINRAPEDRPVPYAEANLPQSWAAGSVLMLLRAILGLDPDPARRRLIVTPTLPEWLPELTLRNFTVFGGKLDLHFQGTGTESVVKVLGSEGDMEVEFQRID